MARVRVRSLPTYIGACSGADAGAGDPGHSGHLVLLRCPRRQQDEDEEEPRRAKRRPVAGSGGAHTSAFGSRCDASRMTLSTMLRLLHRRRTRRHETCVGRTCRACNDSEGTWFMVCGWWFDG